MKTRVGDFILAYSRLAFEFIEEGDLIGVLTKLFKLCLVENKLLKGEVGEDVIDFSL